MNPGEKEIREPLVPRGKYFLGQVLDSWPDGTLKEKAPQAEKPPDPHKGELRPIGRYLLWHILTFWILDWCVFICIMVYSASSFYMIYLAGLIPDFILGGAVLNVHLAGGQCRPKKKGESGTEPIDHDWVKREEDLLTVEESCYRCASFRVCGKREWSATSWWRFTKVYKWTLFALLWSRAFVLFCDVSGVCLGSRAGQSTCSNNPYQPGTVFNLRGGFTGSEVYSSSSNYVFCTLYAKWGYPAVEDYVAQFEVDATTGELDCFTQTANPTGASVLTEQYQCGAGSGLLGYPSLGRGVPTGAGSIAAIQTGQTPNSSTQNICPGYESLPQCYYPDDPNRPVSCSNREVCRRGNFNVCYQVPIRPSNVCSRCLGFWRATYGGGQGPSGYAHCQPFQYQDPTDAFCAFCPGLGEGWLGGEVVTTDAILTTFWLATTMSLILPFLEMAFLFMRMARRHSKKTN